jgi:hypothetical protein
MRRFSKPLMIVITVLVIIAFTWLYSDTRFMDQMGSDRVGTIYGRNVTQVQLIRAARNYELSLMLQLNEMVKSLANLPSDMPDFFVGMRNWGDEAVEEFAWNSMVIRHEAQRLGITSTQEERDEAIKQLPPLQTNGAFDPGKLGMFIQNGLSPRGMSADALEELVADHVMLRKIKTLLGTTVAPAPSEVRTAYESSKQKLETSVVRFKFADFLAAAQAPEEEVKKAFEERKATLMTDELRSVKFIAFMLPPSEKPLVGKERVDLLSQLSEKAQEASVAMTEKDAKLEDVAAKLGGEVKQTPAFAQNDPPVELGDSEEAAQAAFQLKKEDPNSDVVQTDKGYYILQLADITPARPKAYEEAKGELETQLKNERAREAMNLKATEIRNKIDAELKAGKPFAEAAAAAGATVEAFPPFSFSEPEPKEPDAREIMTAAADLDEGQLSPFTPTQGSPAGPGTGGGVLVFLAKKQPIDETKFEQEKAQFAEQVIKSSRDALFREWLRLRRAEANVQLANRRA